MGIQIPVRMAALLLAVCAYASAAADSSSSPAQWAQWVQRQVSQLPASRAIQAEQERLQALEQEQEGEEQEEAAAEEHTWDKTRARPGRAAFDAKRHGWEGYNLAKQEKGKATPLAVPPSCTARCSGNAPTSASP